MRRKNRPRARSKAKKRVVRSRPLKYSTLTAHEKLEYERAIDLLSDLRRGVASYTKLLRAHRLTTRKAQKYLRRNLLGGTRGKPVRASKTDNLIRELWFPRRWGDVREPVTGLHAATEIANFRHDRGKLLDDKMSADEFEDKWRGVRVDGRELFAVADEIFRMQDADVLKLESLYASVDSER